MTRRVRPERRWAEEPYDADKCPACGDDLGGLEPPAHCPECGHETHRDGDGTAIPPSEPP